MKQCEKTAQVLGVVGIATDVWSLSRTLKSKPDSGVGKLWHTLKILWLTLGVCGGLIRCAAWAVRHLERAGAYTTPSLERARAHTPPHYTPPPPSKSDSGDMLMAFWGGSQTGPDPPPAPMKVCKKGLFAGKRLKAGDAAAALECILGEYGVSVPEGLR